MSYRNRKVAMREKEIQKQIVEYLRKRGAFVWEDKQDYRKGRYFKPSTRGVSDVLGIYKGRPLAIEVKTPTGKLRKEQAIFLADFTAAGGIAFTARSVEEVAEMLGD